jgi:hypothetical protein
MQKFRTLFLTLALVTVGISTIGCAWRAPFNQYSFDETARLKTESTALLAKSDRSYALNFRKAEALQANVVKAYQDAQLRALNEESMQVWLVILDAQQLSLAGALNRWKLNDTLSADERREFQNRVAQNFDDISKLEGEKKR